MFCITKLGLGQMEAIQTYHKPTLLMTYRMHPLSGKLEIGSLASFSTFELMQELMHQGWSMERQGASKRLTPYKPNGQKLFYFTTSLNSPYLKCLLCADVLFKSGLKHLHHFQPVQYYKTILLLRDKLGEGEVLPNQPLSYYQVLQQRKGFVGDCSKRFQLEEDTQPGMEGTPAGSSGRGDLRRNRKTTVVVEVVDSDFERGDSDCDGAAADVSPESEVECVVPGVDPEPKTGTSQQPNTPLTATAKQLAQSATSTTASSICTRARPLVLRVEPRGKHPSTMWNPSTVWVAGIPIVRREDTAVPTYYVRCPLHRTHRTCTKSIQENQGGQDIVIQKLLYWLAAGHLALHRAAERLSSSPDTIFKHIVLTRPPAACHPNTGLT